MLPHQGPCGEIVQLGQGLAAGTPGSQLYSMRREKGNHLAVLEPWGRNYQIREKGKVTKKKI